MMGVEAGVPTAATKKKGREPFFLMAGGGTFCRPTGKQQSHTILSELLCPISSSPFSFSLASLVFVCALGLLLCLLLRLFLFFVFY